MNVGFGVYLLVLRILLECLYGLFSEVVLSFSVFVVLFAGVCWFCVVLLCIGFAVAL